jgi:hypothetical protein
VTTFTSEIIRFCPGPGLGFDIGNGLCQNRGGKNS